MPRRTTTSAMCSKSKANWRTRWPAISRRWPSSPTSPRPTTTSAMRCWIKLKRTWRWRTIGARWPSIRPMPKPTTTSAMRSKSKANLTKRLALKPGFAEAHNNLGTALQDQGRLAEAIAQYRRALALNPGYAEAHGNLGKALMEGGDLTQALRALQRSIETGESENAKVLFVQCVRSLNFIPQGVDLRENLIRALSEPWGRPIDLAKFAGNLVKRNGATSICISRATGAWPKRLPAQELFSPSEFAEVCDDQLLRCLLESTPVCDIELEPFLTALRFTMLEAASAGLDTHQVEENALSWFCALAQQCFINEYIFALTDHEIERAQRLRALLVEALASGTSIPELCLVAVAAYFPLASLPVAELIPERPWSAAVAALVARQVWEGQEERQLQTSVPRLTPIEDGVSLRHRPAFDRNCATIHWSRGS